MAVRPAPASLKPSSRVARYSVGVRGNVTFVRSRPTQGKARREATTLGGAISAEGCLLLGPRLSFLAPRINDMPDRSSVQQWALLDAEHRA